MSTMEPEVMEGGRSMEGNSIWILRRQLVRDQGAFGLCVRLGTHQALILCEQDGDASIDFTDSERDQHVGMGGRLVAVCCRTFACVDVPDRIRPEWD